MTSLPALREAVAKGIKLLEALAEPHEQPDGEDHAWRTCRRCLALEEGETEHARQLFRAMLDELEAARANYSDIAELLFGEAEYGHDDVRLRVVAILDELEAARADIANWPVCEQHKPGMWDGDPPCVICEAHTAIADLAAARAVLKTAKLHKREVTVLSSQVVVVVDRAAWQTWQAQETDHMAEVGKLVIPAMEREDA